MKITEMQRQVLDWLATHGPDATVESAGRKAYVDPECGVFHISTLKSMENRGWVTIETKYEGALHSSDRPYKIARITSAGRAVAMDSPKDTSKPLLLEPGSNDNIQWICPKCGNALIADPGAHERGVHGGSKVVRAVPAGLSSAERKSFKFE